MLQYANLFRNSSATNEDRNAILPKKTGCRGNVPYGIGERRPAL